MFLNFFRPSPTDCLWQPLAGLSFRALFVRGQIRISKNSFPNKERSERLSVYLKIRGRLGRQTVFANIYHFYKNFEHFFLPFIFTLNAFVCS